MRIFTRLSLILALWLGACAPATATAPAPSATPQRPTSTPRPRATPTPAATALPDIGAQPADLRGVKIVVWHGLDGDTARLLEQSAAEFSQANPWGIGVTVRGHGNLAGLLESIASAEKDGGLPDSALALPEHLTRWDGQSLLADLNPYVFHPEFGLTAAEIADIPPAFWAQDISGNARLGVPAQRAARFLFYNLSRARELGFEKAPRTQKEFREQACAANADWKADSDPTNDGYGGWAADGNPWTVYSWLVAGGGEVTAEDAFDFATPENQAALELLFEMRAAGCLWVPTNPANREALVNRAAMFMSGGLEDLDSQAAAFRALNSEDAWTVIPFPAETVVAYGLSLGVFKGKPAQQAAAWLFARHILSTETQARWARQSGMLPVRLAALDLLKDYKAARPQWAAAAALMPAMRGYPSLPGWPLARTLLGDGGGALLRGYPLVTVEDTLEMMDATMNEWRP